MKKKIQKIGLLLGLLMFANAPLLAYSAETQSASTRDELPNFLPKDYKITGTLWGTWKAWSLSYEDMIHPEPPSPKLDFMTLSKKWDRHNNTLSIWVDVFMQTKWESAHKAPFKFKTTLDLAIQPDKGFVCDGETVKLWFDNGQSIEVPSRGDKACKVKEDYYDGALVNILTQTDDDPSQAMAEYRLTEMIQSHKPVALTQGKKVVLIKSLDEKPIQKYQEMVNPKLHPDYIEALKKSYDQDISDAESTIREKKAKLG